MEQKAIRTLIEVLDYKTGNIIIADEFFQKPIDEITVCRSELQKAIEKIREPLYVCSFCKQKVRIRGGITTSHKRKAEILHFAHLKDSDECHFKTQNPYSKEDVDRIKYNGAKESDLHQFLKGCIAECLIMNQGSKKEVSSVQVEKIIKNKKVTNEWKKPDINTLYNKKRIAIELQLSTTWLSVITRRQHFYKENGIYILWIFHAFSINDDERKFTYNDVIYTNNQNAYIFDYETYEMSITAKDLILKCFYKTYYQDYQKLCERWDFSFIKLSDLTFDEKRIRIYYHDSESQKKKIEKEINAYVSELKETDRLRNIQEQENLIKENEQKINKLNETSNSLKDYFSMAVDYTDKIINYFSHNFHFHNKPLYGHDDLITTLNNEYQKNIMNLSIIIEEKNKEQQVITNEVEKINKISTIEITGKIYYKLNQQFDWAFIKKQFAEIKIDSLTSL